jgi:hypothetical protein
MCWGHLVLEKSWADKVSLGVWTWASDRKLTSVITRVPCHSLRKLAYASEFWTQNQHYRTSPAHEEEGCIFRAWLGWMELGRFGWGLFSRGWELPRRRNLILWVNRNMLHDLYCERIECREEPYGQ